MLAVLYSSLTSILKFSTNAICFSILGGIYLSSRSLKMFHKKFICLLGNQDTFFFLFFNQWKRQFCPHWYKRDFIYYKIFFLNEFYFFSFLSVKRKIRFYLFFVSTIIPPTFSFIYWFMNYFIKNHFYFILAELLSFCHLYFAIRVFDTSCPFEMYFYIFDWSFL